MKMSNRLRAPWPESVAPGDSHLMIGGVQRVQPPFDAQTAQPYRQLPACPCRTLHASQMGASLLVLLTIASTCGSSGNKAGNADTDCRGLGPDADCDAGRAAARCPPGGPGAPAAAHDAARGCRAGTLGPKGAAAFHPAVLCLHCEIVVHTACHVITTKWFTAWAAGTTEPGNGKWLLRRGQPRRAACAASGCCRGRPDSHRGENQGKPDAAPAACTRKLKGPSASASTKQVSLSSSLATHWPVDANAACLGMCSAHTCKGCRWM